MEATAPGGLALVMSGGGARAAYQVGVLRVLGRLRPRLPIQILTGVSAGAINAAFLASRSNGLRERSEELASLWDAVTVEEVVDANPAALAASVLRWGLQLISGGRLRRRPLHGLMDTAPLGSFLRRHLGATADGRIPGIAANLEAGALCALAITASSYSTGQSVTWVQGCALPMWERAHRRSVRAEIRVDHILASSALPILFPAVEVDGAWYGDGGIRLTAPLSPAVHLGAERILAISTRYARTGADAARPVVQAYPPAAQVAGELLGAIFLDVFDADALSLQRLNRLIDGLPEERRQGLRRVELLLLRPSLDLGRLANDYEPRLPRGFRFLTRGLGTRETRRNDLLSLLMFQPDYLQRLVALGEADAEARRGELEAFLPN